MVYWDVDDEDLDNEEFAENALENVQALLAAVAAHHSLMDLELSGFPLQLPAVLDAVVALSTRLRRLKLQNCDLSPASAPALVRLLHSTTLRTLEIYNDVGPTGESLLLDAPAGALLATALRANSTLTALRLTTVDLWRDAAAAAAAAPVLAAVVGHPSLRVLMFADNSCAPAEAQLVSGALSALVAANAPALEILDIGFCEGFNDAILHPIFEALRRNTHLHELNCLGNDVSTAFARDVMLPAVRANLSLRHLAVSVGGAEVGLPQPTLEAVRRSSSAEELSELLPWLTAA